MITLVMLVNQLRNSGPNRVMLDLARNLDRSKVTPVVVSFMPDNKVRPIAHLFEQADVEIHRFNYSKLALETKVNNIREELEEFISSRFESPIVQAHGYHPTLITSGMTLPHTVTIHCIASEDYIASKGKLLGNYMVWRFKRHLKKHTTPVAISSYMRDYYLNICGNKISIIHNGVNFMPYKVDIVYLREQLGLPKDKRVIVIPGGLHSRKNNSHTIRELKKLDKEFLCIFLGLGTEENMLKELAGDDSRFSFLGYKENIREYLACADLYISSSLSEGLPLAALEAVCMGVPSLLSDIPPHREIATILNTNGVDVFSLKEGHLCTKVKNYLHSNFDYKKISDNAIKHFSASTMARKYEDLFFSIVNNNHK